MRLHLYSSISSVSNKTRIYATTRLLIYIIVYILTFYLKSFLPHFNTGLRNEIILVLTTGSMIVLWLSELITEYGLGNGPSLIIFTNIVSNLPKLFIRIKNQNISIKYWLIIGFSLILITCGLILLQEGVRFIPLISATQLNQIGKSTIKNIELNKSYIPLRFNQVGIMPVILTNNLLKEIFGTNISKIFYFCKIPINSLLLNFLYWISYFILILTFSLLYSTFEIDPLEISTELQNMSISIPGIRPGYETIFYLKQIIKRIIFLNSLTLVCLSLIPHFLEFFLTNFNLNEINTFSLLIVTGTISDLYREIRSIILSNIYNINILK